MDTNQTCSAILSTHPRPRAVYLFPKRLEILHRIKFQAAAVVCEIHSQNRFAIVFAHGFPPRSLLTAIVSLPAIRLSVHAHFARFLRIFGSSPSPRGSPIGQDTIAKKRYLAGIGGGGTTTAGPAKPHSADPGAFDLGMWLRCGLMKLGASLSARPQPP